LDIWVRPDTLNASRVLAALAAFGAPLHDLTESDLASPGTIFQIGVAPIRIDVITAIDGVAFENADVHPHSHGGRDAAPHAPGRRHARRAGGGAVRALRRQQRLAAIAAATASFAVEITLIEIVLGAFLMRWVLPRLARARDEGRPKSQVFAGPG